MSSTRPIDLIQLTDLHLSADPEAEYRGFRAGETLKSLAPVVKHHAPDTLVLTGDVSEDGSASSYRRVARVVGPWCDDIAWLPGNHDRKRTMEEEFKRPGWTRGPVLERGGWQIVLLDSAWPDRPEGELDDERLAPLDGLKPGRPALVFVHHQPSKIGAPWIDKYPLINSERLWRRLDPEIVRIVAFGHVHQVYEREYNGIACLAAPSTVANSRAATERFDLDPTGPGLRWFRLWPDGRWTSQVLRAGSG